jgi:hypothetical protein
VVLGAGGSSPLAHPRRVSLLAALQAASPLPAELTRGPSPRTPTAGIAACRPSGGFAVARRADPGASPRTPKAAGLPGVQDASTRVEVLKYPAAVQALADTHDTPLRTFPLAPSFGLGTTDQAVPFHVSISVLLAPDPFA